MLDFLGTVDAGELPGGEIVVSARGPIDERVATSFRNALVPLTGAGAAPLFLDLGGAHGLDAAAMTVIVDAAHLLRDHGSRLGIVTRSPIVLSLIRECGIETVVDVAPTLAEAIAR
jgi:anti-anti-sigma factor